MSKFDEIKQKLIAVQEDHGPGGFVALTPEELDLLLSVAVMARKCDVCAPSLEDGAHLSNLLKRLF